MAILLVFIRLTFKKTPFLIVNKFKVFDIFPKFAKTFDLERCEFKMGTDK